MLLQTSLFVALFLEARVISFYTFKNASNKFKEYKMEYNKKYSSTNEGRKHYIAFIKNLNAAETVNATAPPNTIYVMNKYADLDPIEVEDQYAINLMFYNKVENGNRKELITTNGGIDINKHNLYDLYDSKKLFAKYREEQNRNYTSDQERLIHYYRFVKTLVEKNRNAYAGFDDAELDDKADILRASHEFYY